MRVNQIRKRFGSLTASTVLSNHLGISFWARLGLAKTLRFPDVSQLCKNKLRSLATKSYELYVLSMSKRSSNNHGPTFCERNLYHSHVKLSCRPRVACSSDIFSDNTDSDGFALVVIL